MGGVSRLVTVKFKKVPLTCANLKVSSEILSLTISRDGIELEFKTKPSDAEIALIKEKLTKQLGTEIMEVAP